MQALNRVQADLARRIFAVLATGNAESALADARRLVALAPGAPDAHHALAVSLVRAGQLEAADRAFLAALALAPRQPMILANRARALTRQGRHGEASDCWRQCLVAAPQDATAWQEFGLSLLTDGAGEALEEAVSVLRTAVSLAPRAVRAWHGLACALRGVGALAEAEAALRQAIALAPEQSELWVSLGGVLRLSGQASAALLAYDRAAQLGAAGPEFVDARVGALVDDLRLDEALALAERNASEHPAHAAAQITLAELRHEYAAAPEQAAVEFGCAADRHPERLELQLGYVRFLLRLGRPEAALQRISELCRRHRHPALDLVHAQALQAVGDLDAAAVLFERLEAVLSDQPLYQNARVRFLLRHGAPRLAAERAEEILQRRPYDQENLAYLGTAWRMLGDAREQWLCDYQRLVTLVPVPFPAGEEDGFLQSLRESLEALHRAHGAPLSQSVRGGTQTPGRLFGRPDPSLKALEAALRQSIEGWLRQLPDDPTHPFLARRSRSFRFAGSWSVRLLRSGSHVDHFHQEGWISSAFYAHLPPSVQEPAGGDPHAGWLRLGQPPLDLGLDLPPRRWIQPKLGHVALFPSYLWHGTEPFDDPVPRLTVAFDLQPARA